MGLMRSRLALVNMTVCFCAYAAPAFAQDAPPVQIYGSLRMHINAVTVDEAAGGQGDSFTGLTDAYSRVGVKANWDMGSTAFAAKAELGLNTVDVKLGDPSFFDDQNMRIYSVSASGD